MINRKGLNEPSEIGVVKKIDGHFTARDLAELDFSSRNKRFLTN
jgi:hypothetical protein